MQGSANRGRIDPIRTQFKNSTTAISIMEEENEYTPTDHRHNSFLPTESTLQP
jgi:hypothetical protein